MGLCRFGYGNAPGVTRGVMKIRLRSFLNKGSRIPLLQNFFGEDITMCNVILIARAVVAEMTILAPRDIVQRHLLYVLVHPI